MSSPTTWCTCRRRATTPSCGEAERERREKHGTLATLHATLHAARRRHHPLEHLLRRAFALGAVGQEGGHERPAAGDRDNERSVRRPVAPLAVGSELDAQAPLAVLPPTVGTARASASASTRRRRRRGSGRRRACGRRALRRAGRACCRRVARRRVCLQAGHGAPRERPAKDGSTRCGFRGRATRASTRSATRPCRGARR